MELSKYGSQHEVVVNHLWPRDQNINVFTGLVRVSVADSGCAISAPLRRATEAALRPVV